MQSLTLNLLRHIHIRRPFTNDTLNSEPYRTSSGEVIHHADHAPVVAFGALSAKDHGDYLENGVGLIIRCTDRDTCGLNFWWSGSI
jgi:hypothetical protein